MLIMRWKYGLSNLSVVTVWIADTNVWCIAQLNLGSELSQPNVAASEIFEVGDVIFLIFDNENRAEFLPLNGLKPRKIS